MLRELFDAMFRTEPNTAPPVVVLSDLDEARAALERALEDADPTLEPGLRRAAALLDGVRRPDDDLVLAWARRVLDDAGIDPRTDEVGAVRRLRATVPGDMPLLPAALLTRRVIDALGPRPVQ